MLHGTSGFIAFHAESYQHSLPYNRCGNTSDLE